MMQLPVFVNKIVTRKLRSTSFARIALHIFSFLLIFSLHNRNCWNTLIRWSPGQLVAQPKPELQLARQEVTAFMAWLVRLLLGWGYSLLWIIELVSNPVEFYGSITAGHIQDCVIREWVGFLRDRGPTLSILGFDIHIFGQLSRDWLEYGAGLIVQSKGLILE